MHVAPGAVIASIASASLLDSTSTFRPFNAMTPTLRTAAVACPRLPIWRTIGLDWMTAWTAAPGWTRIVASRTLLTDLASFAALRLALKGYWPGAVPASIRSSIVRTVPGGSSPRLQSAVPAEVVQEPSDALALTTARPPVFISAARHAASRHPRTGPRTAR